MDKYEQEKADKKALSYAQVGIRRQTWTNFSNEAVNRGRVRHGEDPQNKDGCAHFAYYDWVRMLSFVWRGEGLVEVCWGGYGEPIFWTFRFQDYQPEDSVIIVGCQSAALAFKDACDMWIESMES